MGRHGNDRRRERALNRTASWACSRISPDCALFWCSSAPTRGGQSGKRPWNGGWRARSRRTGAAQSRPKADSSEADCRVSRGIEVSWPSTYKRGHHRIPPPNSVYFDEVQLRWYMNRNTGRSPARADNSWITSR